MVADGGLSRLTDGVACYRLTTRHILGHFEDGGVTSARIIAAVSAQASMITLSVKTASCVRDGAMVPRKLA